MPPNNKEILFRFDQAASVFDQPVYNYIGKEKQEERESDSQENDSRGEEENVEGTNNVRITTRARWTYELDRYAKNAMLIIDNKDQLNSGLPKLTLKEAFTRYGFEVESHENVTRDEIVAVSERFFQRDFSDYGAVAVAILAEVDPLHNYVAKNSVFTETDVLKYFTRDQPPTLQGKPKISIVEASQYGYNKRSPIEHPDILRFHVPVSFSSYSFRNEKPSVLYRRHDQLLRPLQLLSKEMLDQGDKKDLYTIMVSSTMSTIKTWSIIKQFPIKIESTLKKELMLFSNSIAS